MDQPVGFVVLMDRSAKYASSKDKSMGGRPGNGTLDFLSSSHLSRWVYDDGGGLLCLCERVKR